MTATQAPTPGPLPNMPTVDLTDDMLFTIETGEIVTWGDLKRRLRLAPTAPVEASGSEPSWKTALLELKDKLWIARCDSRDEGFRAAAERAIKMADDADWSPLNPARAEAQDEGAAGEASAYRVRMISDDPAEWVLMHPEKALDFLSRKGWEIQPLYAHPSPTPAADADRVRIAVEALEPFRLAANNMDGDEPDSLFIYDSPESTMISYGDLRRAASVHDALKSTAAKEGGE